MKKIYIAGPMTGYENFNRDEFNRVAEIIENVDEVALNPAVLPDGLEQREYMDICFAMLRCATAIYMLSGYTKSKGALAELAYAEKLGIEIIYQDNTEAFKHEFA